MKSLILCLVAVLALTGCYTTGRHAINDTTELQGFWTCESAVVDGKALPAKEIANLRLRMSADHYTVIKGPDVLADYYYKVDHSKRPRQINVISAGGELTSMESHGIYSASGGTFRMCHRPAGGKRPTKFESGAGSQVFLFVWKREKKAK